VLERGAKEVVREVHVDAFDVGLKLEESKISWIQKEPPITGNLLKTGARDGVLSRAKNKGMRGEKYISLAKLD